MRTRLTDQLGVEWKPVQNGMAEIEGFSEELLAHYSTRRAEIEMMLEAMKAEGDLLSPRKAAQAATRDVIAEAVGRGEATPVDAEDEAWRVSTTVRCWMRRRCVDWLTVTVLGVVMM